MNKKDFLLNVNDIKSTPELIRKNKNIIINNNIDNKYKRVLEQFCKVLGENFDKSKLINFFNNINELRITKANFWEKVASYIAIDNLIRIPRDSFESLYHELFHLASTYLSRNKLFPPIFSGFEQTNFRKSFGMGLNEGYTQLLAERYFNDVDYVKGSYIYLTNIASCIELIVGKDKMELLYLNCNLKVLVEELKKYLLEEDIMKLITYLDFIKKKNKYNLNDETKKQFFEYEKSIVEILFKAYKLKLLKYEKYLSSNEIHIRENNYYKKLCLFSSFEDFESAKFKTQKIYFEMFEKLKLIFGESNINLDLLYEQMLNVSNLIQFFNNTKDKKIDYNFILYKANSYKGEYENEYNYIQSEISQDDNKSRIRK